MNEDTHHPALCPCSALALFAPVLAQQRRPQPPAAQPRLQPAAGPNTWTIDPNHSTIGFVVRHMMVSNVPRHVRQDRRHGHYDGKDVSSIAADITIDATTITTDNEKRDAHLKSPDFFDVAKFPTITFKSKRVQKAARRQVQADWRSDDARRDQGSDARRRRAVAGDRRAGRDAASAPRRRRRSTVRTTA